MSKEVNFEIAKLLKEKGFDTIDCGGYYHVCDGYTKGYAYCYSDVNTQKENAILAPTIAEVVMWLYENHKIWIYVDGDCRPHIIKDNVDLNHKGEVNRTVLLEGKTKIQYCWDSPTEAYGAAIKYVLENLIQGGNK